MSEKKYQIRGARIGDEHRLVNLASIGFPGYPFKNVYQADTLTQNIIQGEMRIVATLPSDLQHIVATAVLGIDGEIKRVIVDPIHKRNGLARDMTGYLVKVADLLGLHPFTDTRADQIGMQRASSAAGLIAYSIEPGKHVVYKHIANEEDLGPARESMIHMSSLKPDENTLHQMINDWDSLIKNALLTQIHDSYSPKLKNRDTVSSHLPTADSVKKRVYAQIETRQNGIKLLRDEDDITTIEYGGVQMMIIKPDASGFIQCGGNIDHNAIKHMLAFAKHIGLQIVTTYQDAKEKENIKTLFNAGLIPAMIRPWQNPEESVPKWQIGLRATMNGYEECLHNIDLDPDVGTQLNDFLGRLERNII